jgi:hypothetical protein
MNDSAGVNVPKRISNLKGDIHGDRKRHRSPTTVLQAILKRRASDELHDQVRNAAFSSIFQGRYDIRVAQLEHVRSHTFKAGESMSIFEEVIVWHIQGHVLIQPGVVSSVNNR